MQRQSRYIAARLTGPFLVIALCLTGVVWLTQSLRFVDLIVNHGLSISTFLTLTGLMTPLVLGAILPIALLVAVLHVYHRLISDSEFVILRATGSSNARLAAPALALGAVVAAAVLAINLWLMPAGFRAFKDRQFALRHSLASMLLREGMFDTPLNGVTIFVRERGDDGSLRGILMHDSRNRGEPETVVAERGMLVATADEPRFVLENGSRQQIDKEDGRPSFLFFDRYAFDLSSETDSPGPRFREAKERYLHELLRPGDSAAAHHRREFAAELYRRLIGPLHAVVLALIACAALLTGEFNRRRQLWRVLAGGGAGGAFTAGALGLQHAIAGTPWLAVLYCLGVVGCGLAAAALLLSETRRRFGGRRGGGAPVRAG